MQLSQLSAFWQRLTAVQRISLASLLFFLAILPVGIWLAMSPTSPFSKATDSGSTSSIFGQSIYFDNHGTNDTYITVGKSGLLGVDRTSQDDANSFTVETWVKIPQSLSSNVYDFLLYKPSVWFYPDYLFRFWFNQGSGNAVYPNFAAAVTYIPTHTNSRDLEMFVLGSPRTDGGYDSPPRVSLTPNQWNHIAVVGRSENFSTSNKTGTCRLKLYVNGTLAGDERESIPNKSCRFAVADGESLFIGKKRGDLNQGFTGEIDELRISRWPQYTQNFTPPTRPFFEGSGSNDGSTLLMQFNGDFRTVWASVSGEITGNHYQFVNSDLTLSSPSPSPTPSLLPNQARLVPQTQTSLTPNGRGILTVNVASMVPSGSAGTMTRGNIDGSFTGLAANTQYTVWFYESNFSAYDPIRSDQMVSDGSGNMSFSNASFDIYRRNDQPIWGVGLALRSLDLSSGECDKENPCISGFLELTPPVSPTPTIIPSPTPTPSPSPSPSPSPTTIPSQTFRIGSGFSMVGLPISKPGTYRAEDFLKDLNSAFVSSGSTTTNPVQNIFEYDNANGRWKIHTLGSTTDDNFAIGSGKGYFVRSLGSGTSTLSGGGIANTLIVLRSGWSLISVLPNSGYATAEDFLQTAKTRCSQANADVIVKWQGGRYVPHQVDSEANNFSLSPGEGYWVRNSGSYCDFLAPQ